MERGKIAREFCHVVAAYGVHLYANLLLNLSVLVYSKRSFAFPLLGRFSFDDEERPRMLLDGRFAFY